ncbi:sulfurtransferase complex subunit TusC [Pontibacter sp. JAM-7]|uniref:sulfurtransferase complex subunit TusC n=1 Tax=Pontibacter sp. JAM-7 TaxID=3366581 RepID=UPI003AF47AA4
MAEQHNVLLVHRNPPYGSNLPRDGLDIALTCAIFDLPVSLLFLGDGLYQLLASQAADEVNQKSLQALLSSLPMYDIDTLYVCAEDLQARNVTADELITGVQVIKQQQLPELFQQHKTVLTF